jgi:ubiquinone/menaquinone biosynthesis C-methylase UbiE
MQKEIDLLINYPKTKRNLQQRSEQKSEKDREIARKFGKDFFDGDRKHGYGGYNYNPKFWQQVVPTFREYWDLKSSNSILDVGCGKGFMLYDFTKQIAGIKIKGIDISSYAVEQSVPQIKKFIEVGNAKKLPFKDNSFDFTISINTIHNLEISECAQALKEISRVSKIGSFITVDAYNNEDEKIRMNAWNLTAKTIMSTSEWKKFFKETGYKGDYYWFIP